jgi:uncharacterized membrane protein YgaE (UPF0421/DUF939 family)
MDAGRFSLQRMTLRAYDLSERTARAGKDSVGRRIERLQSRAFMIIQAAVTAGLAWVLASLLVGPRPFFAPVAAIITLGFSFGQRWRRAAEVAVGVSVGVGIGLVFIRFFGTGSWQIVLVCLAAMAIAVLLGAGTLMTTQAGVQAIIVIALPEAGAGLDRWLDALIGCALALLVATIAPLAPLRRPGTLAASFLQEVAATLRAAVDALRAGDRDVAEAVLARARSGEDLLADLEDAAKEGVAVVRQSIFLRRRLPEVRAYADLYPPLDRTSRNLRVLARRSATALWRGESVPASYLELLDQLCEVINFMAGELYAHRLPTAARKRLIAVGAASADLQPQRSMSTVVVLAQARSMIVDLLELTGLDPAEARESIPDVAD